MKVIMTGGGTGGHIYPAIAIADKIMKKHPDAEILFIGTERGLEKDIVPANGYKIKFITVSGFNRKKLLKNVKTLRDAFKGSAQAREIIKDFQPDLVVGTGGYVCGPVIREAHKKKIPCFIHEQNALPGVTNKMLEKMVERVFVSFPEAVSHFKRKDKVVVTGNPIRKAFLVSGIKDYRKKLSIGDGEFVVLCFGGSRGAGKINSIMTAAAETFAGMQGIRLYFITGKPHYNSIKEDLEAKGVLEKGNVVLMPYAENIHEYMFASDLIISRAGALTISEITVCGKASILIPSPNVTGNHQYYNAKVVADGGGAILIEEKDLTEEKIISGIMRLKNTPELLNAMSKASRELGRVDAADAVYDYFDI